MNLYDKDDGFKTFTLEEANVLLPEIIAVTENAIHRLEQAKSAILDSATDERIRIESTEILTEWSQKIVQFGAYPKGYFTVDFKSRVPDTLLCWTYSEKNIAYTHKINETFQDRVPIQREGQIGFETSLN